MLILDVPTRWASTFYMLDKFLVLFDDVMIFAISGGFEGYGTGEPLQDLILASEYHVLEGFADAMAPVADFVRICEGEHYPTLAFVAPLFAHVQRQLQIPRNQRISSVEKRFRKLLLQQLNARLGYLTSVPNLSLAASALHPAFARLNFISEELKDEVWREIHILADEFGSLPEDESEDGDAAPTASPKPYALISKGIFQPGASRDGRGRYLNDIRRMLKACTKDNITLSEALTKAAKDEQYNVLSFWKMVEEAHNYDPILFVPRIILATPGTSAPSERMFSGSIPFKLPLGRLSKSSF